LIQNIITDVTFAELHIKSPEGSKQAAAAAAMISHLKTIILLSLSTKPEKLYHKHYYNFVERH